MGQGVHIPAAFAPLCSATCLFVSCRPASRPQRMICHCKKVGVSGFLLLSIELTMLLFLSNSARRRSAYMTSISFTNPFVNEAGIAATAGCTLASLNQRSRRTAQYRMVFRLCRYKCTARCCCSALTLMMLNLETASALRLLCVLLLSKNERECKRPSSSSSKSKSCSSVTTVQNGQTRHYGPTS